MKYWGKDKVQTMSEVTTDGYDACQKMEKCDENVDSWYQWWSHSSMNTEKVSIIYFTANNLCVLWHLVRRHLIFSSIKILWCLFKQTDNSQIGNTKNQKTIQINQVSSVNSKVYLEMYPSGTLLA